MHDKVAAVLVEPIQGEGGYVVPPPGYWQRIREMFLREQMRVIQGELGEGDHGAVGVKAGEDPVFIHGDALQHARRPGCRL